MSTFFPDFLLENYLYRVNYLINYVLLLGVRMQIVKIKSALRPPNDLSLVHNNGMSTILRCVHLIFCSSNLRYTTHDYVLSIFIKMMQL